MIFERTLPILLSALSFVACSSVRLKYSADIKAEGDEKTSSYTFEKSYTVIDTKTWCAITGILYGGWCWAYLAMPTKEQRATLTLDASNELRQQIEKRSYKFKNESIERVGWRFEQSKIVLDGSTHINGQPLISDNDRMWEHLEKVNLSSDEAYKRAKIWAAGAYSGDSKSAIQMDEPGKGHFVSRAHVNDCSSFSKVNFLVDFQAKAGRVRILFDKIYAIPKDVNLTTDSLVYPRTKSELDQLASSCLAPIKEDILNEIRRQRGSSEW